MAGESARPKPLAKSVARVVGVMLIALLTPWGTLAMYWSNLPWHSARTVLAIAFTALGLATLIALITARSTRRGLLIFAVAFIIVLAWWSAIQPSHDRDWRPPVSVMPRAEIDGDLVRISGYRNFDYRSNDDFTVRYETREVSLADLESLDLFLSYWSPGGIAAHTFLGFNFRNAPPVCISIEARLEKGETYSALASCFKQHELIYVVGSERDIVGVRLSHRDEEIYRHRVQAQPEAVKRLFLAYLEEINQLAETPRWYHLLRNNCTSNIARLARPEVRRAPLDLRLLFNAYADRFAYDHDLLDTSVPFDELRRNARLDTATWNGE